MSDDLKPCPFCGGAPDVSFDSVSCSCAAAPFVNGSNSANTWNTRVDDTSQAGAPVAVDDAMVERAARVLAVMIGGHEPVWAAYTMEARQCVTAALVQDRASEAGAGHAQASGR